MYVESDKMKEELRIIEKRFYTHVFILLITLGFFLVTYPNESQAEYKHPFFIYSIAGFFLTLLSMFKDSFCKSRLIKNLKKQANDRA